MNQSNPVSRLPGFYPIDKLYKLDLNLWWDGNVPGITNNGNDPALLALATLETLNVDDDFLSQLKGAYSACNFFFDRNIEKEETVG